MLMIIMKMISLIIKNVFVFLEDLSNSLKTPKQYCDSLMAYPKKVV